eukprot:12103490-Alexandrium_andersonii.AAC.1
MAPAQRPGQSRGARRGHLRARGSAWGHSPPQLDRPDVRSNIRPFLFPISEMCRNTNKNDF